MNKKITIGFLIGHVNFSLGKAYLKSLINAAKKREVNIICFFGGHIREYDKNAFINNITSDAFRFITDKNLDGLIIKPSSLRYSLNQKKLEQFIENNLSIPVVSIGSPPLKNTVSIEIDNKQGIREAIKHLVEVHGIDRIGFTQAKKGNGYSDDRLQAYLKTLKAYNIPIRDELMTPPGDYSYETGRKAVELFFDQRKLKPSKDIQAIVASSDNHVFGMMEELKARGISIPDELAIIGFNNKIQAKAVSPPITTVDPHFDRHGLVALDAILSLIAGNKIDNLIQVPTELIIRKSCGCRDSSVKKFLEIKYPDFNSSLNPKDITCNNIKKNKLKIFDDFNIIFDSFKILGPHWNDNLFSCLLEDINNLNTYKFLALFESLLYKSYVKNMDMTLWLKYIHRLRKAMAPLLTNNEILIFTENIFQQARILTDKLINIGSEVRMNKSVVQYHHFIETGLLINSALNFEELKNMIHKELSLQGIREYYLFLFDEYTGEPEYVNFSLAVRDSKRIDLAVEDRKLILDNFVIKEIIDNTKQFNIICKPLYTRDSELGFILFNIGMEDYYYYEVIRQEISTSLQSIINIEELEKAKKERENLVVVIEEKNQSLHKAMNALWGEMELAKKIQTSILPKDQNIPGYKIKTYMQPAAEVGGDYFDILKTGDNTNWLLIGDVSGHGVTAGLIAMMLQTSILTILNSLPDINPLKLFHLANKTLYQNVKHRLVLDNYITVCFLKFTDNGKFIYAGAHQDILIYRNKKKIVEQLETDGCWLCLCDDITKIIEESEFNIYEKSFNLEKDDILLVYTDGLVDITNIEDDFFGIGRLKNILISHCTEPLEKISEIINYEVNSFKNMQEDDISYVMVRKE